jgi:hypothetical protein
MAENLSDDEILSWPVDPPRFPDDIGVLRDRIRVDLGRVEMPSTWEGAHSEVRRLLRTDAGRQERQRRTSVKFPWEAPRFDSALGQRQLRILNAIFLCVVRAGGKGRVGGGDRLEPSVVVHGSTVAFRLTAVAPETRKSKREVSASADRADRLQLSILNVQGRNPELISWEDGEGAPLEIRITEIAVELIATAEINYRDACIRRHLWVSEKREAIRERMAEERRMAEVTARANAIAFGRARLDIRAGSSSYFIASHGLPRTAEWIEDEAIIELDAEISTMEPIRPEHVGQRIECSLVCARSFGRQKSVGSPLGVPLLYSIILRRNGRSMLAYLPGDAFWAIQAQLKAGTLKHLEARYQKPSRGSGELTSLYFY